jgi:hypothetical protein
MVFTLPVGAPSPAFLPCKRHQDVNSDVTGCGDCLTFGRQERTKVRGKEQGCQPRESVLTPYGKAASYKRPALIPTIPVRCERCVVILRLLRRSEESAGSRCKVQPETRIELLAGFSEATRTLVQQGSELTVRLPFKDRSLRNDVSCDRSLRRESTAVYSVQVVPCFRGDQIGSSPASAATASVPPFRSG